MTLWRFTSIILALLAASCLATRGDPIGVYEAPKTALIVMDMQRDFLAEDAKMPIDPDQVEPLIQAVNRATRNAVSKGLEVVYVANAFPESAIISNAVRNHAAIAGTEGAKLDPRLDRVDGKMIEKRAPDAFSNEDLDAHLRNQKVNHLIFAGVFADQCVYWTVRGALNRGYRVSILNSGIGASDQEHLDKAIERFGELGVDIVDVP